MDITDYSRVCYNTKCSKHMKGNQCWYNESAIENCTGRIKEDRRKVARKNTQFDKIKKMNIDELAEFLTQTTARVAASEESTTYTNRLTGEVCDYTTALNVIKAWLESEV